ncbi:hypothetical protein Tco_0233670 [Tanacetum coccineum]
MGGTAPILSKCIRPCIQLLLADREQHPQTTIEIDSPSEKICNGSTQCGVKRPDIMLTLKSQDYKCRTCQGLPNPSAAQPEQIDEIPANPIALIKSTIIRNKFADKYHCPIGMPDNVADKYQRVWQFSNTSSSSTIAVAVALSKTRLSPFLI